MPSASDTPGFASPTLPAGSITAMETINGDNAKLEASHFFSGFSIPIPALHDIVGIELVVTAAFSPSGVSGTANDCFRIAPDGRTFTDALSPNAAFPSLTDGVATRTFGGSSNLLDLSPTLLESAAAASFESLVITYIHPAAADIFHVDELKIVIHYQKKPGAPIQIISGRVQLINGRISI